MTMRRDHHLFGHMQRKQNVLVRLTSTGDDGIRAATEELTRVIEQPHLQLVGLCGTLEPDITDAHLVDTVVGRMIGLMEQVRRDHGVILTELILEEGHDPSPGAGARLLHQDELIAAIDEALDEACARNRFPRPSITLVTGPAVVAHPAEHDRSAVNPRQGEPIS
ncbi:decarboxylase [Rhodococcus opacus]|uniref:decarboxylase n=1 Tax=Rhodococcus opacus TaxID=37919 RepID=UPI001FF4E400|nr:decarboxylase [Rhodococcus opacus]UOT01575.1 decarboxylase [Rhodococcus opacus]